MARKEKPEETAIVWVADRERYEANRYSRTLEEFSLAVVYLEPSVVVLEENAA